MGKTYARSLLANYFTVPESLFLLDVKPVTESYLKQVPADNFTSTADHKTTAADILLLAVKPQDFEQLAEAIRPYLQPEQIVLSIMAGVTMHTLESKLGIPKIVRAMPNLPAQIGMGMTVFTCTSALDKKELFIIQNLLNATGKLIYVEK